MTEVLKQKILDHVNQERRSVRDLERQAGLRCNAVHNILSDRSKSPSMDIVLKIADAIGCSLDEIFERKEFINKNTTLDERNIELNIVLFQSTCKYVSEFISKNNLENLKLSDATYCIKEIYGYCLNAQSKNFDSNFAQWFLMQKLIK